jgi:hypothetical protein
MLSTKYISGMKMDREIIKMVANNRLFMKFIVLVGLGFARSIAIGVMLRLICKKITGCQGKALDWLSGI